MPVLLQTVFLLILSNLFMTFAWYWHLGSLGGCPWLVAVVVSWGIAFFEYLLQVPANRIGHTNYSLWHLKIIQEAIALTVFIPIAILFLKQSFRWDYIWAALCILAAVFFIFRSSLNGT